MYSVRVQPITIQHNGPLCRHCFNVCGTPMGGSDCCDSCAAVLVGMADGKLQEAEKVLLAFQKSQREAGK